MTPEDRKAFWIRMGEGKQQSNARHWDPAAFGLKPLTREERILQDWAALSISKPVDKGTNRDILDLTEEDLSFLAELKVGV